VIAAAPEIRPTRISRRLAALRADLLAYAR